MELKEYLQIVFEMEKEIFFQNQLINQLTNEISKLGIPSNFIEPIKPRINIEPNPNKIKKLNIKDFPSLFFGLIKISISLIVLIFSILLITNSNSFSDSIDAFFFIVIGISLILFVSIRLFASSINNFKDFKEKKDEIKHINNENEKKYIKEQKEYEKRLLIYNAEKDQYLKDISLDNQRLEKEIIKKKILLCELEQITFQKNSSLETLKKIYDKNLIYPKYRNLIMVSSLYEYILSGRCDTLEGKDGGYNILELEIRLDKIITRLDTIVANLYEIKNNQFTLFSAIQSSNQKLDDILLSTKELSNSMLKILNESKITNEQITNANSQLKIINSNISSTNLQLLELQNSSRIAAYNSEQIKREINYINRINYHSGNNDAVFFNQPPV